MCNEAKSSGGGLAMDREQLRGCSQSLLMQEVRHRELSPGFLTQYCAKNQVRQGNTHPTSQSRQFRGGLPTTSHHVDTHFLLWMAPLRRCPTPLLVGMMHPCILPSHFPLSPVDGAAAAPSYTFTRGDGASLHLTLPLPTFSCGWCRCGAVLHLYSCG